MRLLHKLEVLEQALAARENAGVDICFAEALRLVYGDENAPLEPISRAEALRFIAEIDEEPLS